jgi:hypothetical protein
MLERFENLCHAHSAKPNWRFVFLGAGFCSALGFITWVITGRPDVAFATNAAMAAATIALRGICKSPCHVQGT